MVEIFEKHIEREIRNNNKIDLSIFKKKGKSKGFKGWYLSRIKPFLKTDPEITYTNLELCEIFQEIYRKYIKFDEIKSTAQVRIARWRGKSGIKIINHPSKFELISYKKPDKGELPKKITRFVSKKDVNLVIMALNFLKDAPTIKEKIKTKEIAREYCNLSNLKETGNGRDLFDKNGFIWELFFGDRHLHPKLVDILNILDYYEVVHYFRSGSVKILKKIIDIQTILP